MITTVATHNNMRAIPYSSLVNERERTNALKIRERIYIFIGKAVNRGDKRTRRVRDRDFVKFERSRRYRDRYRCQSRRGRARDLVFQDPPTPRTSPQSLFADRDPPLTAVATFTTTTIL